MRELRGSTAPLVGGLAVAGVASAPVLAGGTRGLLDEFAIALVVATYTVVGVVIALARPGHPVGRILVAGAGAWGVGEGLLAGGLAGLSQHPGSAGFAALGVIGSGVRGLGWLLLVVVLPLVFPDGRAPWRWASGLAVVCLVTFTTATVLSPQPLEERMGDVANPLGLPPALRPLTDLAALAAVALAFVLLLVAMVGLVRRWRRGGELVRQQVAVFGLAFAPPLLVLPLIATPWVKPWMFALACLPVPVAVGIALLQRRLYDIQLAVSRAAAYLALSLALAGVYALVVGGVGVMLRDRGTPWLPWAAAGAVAVVFAPLRDWLQGVANRLVYGRWSAPAEVLAATGRRLADAADGATLLGALTDELVDGLGLEYAEIRDRGGHTLARAGRASGGAEHLGLWAYGVIVGSLRWAGRPLRDADRALLADLAHQMGGVVHAAGLVEQLQEAQQQLVAAREQERRRLRRDLHDGLGPSLAALGLQVDTARNLLARGEAVDGRLESLRSGLQETVGEVRRIVAGLRPPAIDELGLFGAVAQLGHELVAAAGVDLVLELPDERRALPAAVEVAAYRVAQEALTNVVRHAKASSCLVAATLDEDSLVLEVVDDGRGADADSRPGVGLGSMRERASEIGGRVQVRALSPGTAVTLRLPLRTEVTT